MEAHDRRPDDLIATVRHVDLRREYQSAREPKQRHDAVSYYNRFDVFDLKVNRKRLAPISFVEEGPPDDGGDSTGARGSDHP